MVAICASSRFERLRIPKLIFRGLKRPGAVWTQPELVVEIEYRCWTESDGRLRHAAIRACATTAQPRTSSLLRPCRPARRGNRHHKQLGEEAGATDPPSRGG
ncbi:hypothetical protein ACFQU1_20590 [Chelatococcus sp. GCM10030263]|uniref:ATP dependent DNA ligase n=1 Tax=Chelatococcus sp. GCM10030263 TaxID=3273387 RepID=UPI003616E887